MLKKLRKSKRRTAVEVAKKLGITRDTLRALENGGTSLRVDWLPTLSKLYGVSQMEIVKSYLKEREEKYHD